MPTTTTSPAYRGYKYKFKNVLLSITALFLLLISLLVICSLTKSPILQYGGPFLLDMTRIIFIILATPVAIITLFVGHRIDDSNNKTNPFPLWIELIGLLFGMFLGWVISVEWVFFITISQGLIWTDPMLYLPFPILTPLFTYLFFKGIQLIYARNHQKKFSVGLKLPLFILLLASPVIVYSLYGLYTLLQEQLFLNAITVTNFKEIKVGDTYLFTADLSVPEDNLYHITASVGSTPHATKPLATRLNGIANLDGLYNFQLAKGTNTFSYQPNLKDCAFSKNATFTTTLTINVNKVIAGRFTSGIPHQIKLPVTCHK